MPDPTSTIPNQCSKLGLDLAVRTLILSVLFQLFDITVNQHRNTAGMKIYVWLSRFCGWVNLVDPSLRRTMLEFACSFSCNEIGNLTYKAPGTTLQKITRWRLDSLGIKSNVGVDLLFSLAAIIKFETVPSLLIYSLEQLRILLSFHALYSRNRLALKQLSQTICSTITTESAGSRLDNVPASFKKYEIYELFFQILGGLFVYKQEFDKISQENFLNVMMFGIGKWPQAAKQCIRGLTLALFELPNTSIRLLSGILMNISQYTSNNLAIVNLRYLTALASLPHLHKNLAFEDYKRIFGIALTYLRLNDGQNGQILALGYYVTQVWFLSLKLSERKKYVPIIMTLLLANTSSSESKQPAESVELV